MAYTVKKSVNKKPFQIFITVYLVICTLLCLFTTYLTFINSWRGNAEIAATPYSPVTADLFTNLSHNFSTAFGILWKPLLNSLHMSLIGSAVDVLLGAVLAYLFVYKDFKFKNLIFTVYISVMLLPSIMGMPFLVPFVKNTLGLDNTFIGFLLPNWAGGQVSALFLFRTFFGQQPKSVYESAKVEGANDFQIFLRITLPLALPIMLYHFVGTFSSLYNDFLWSSLLFTNESMEPIMITITRESLTGTIGIGDRGVLYAMYVISSMPLLVSTIVSMKYFSSGDFAAGLKL